MLLWQLHINIDDTGSYNITNNSAEFDTIPRLPAMVVSAAGSITVFCSFEE